MAKVLSALQILLSADAAEYKKELTDTGVLTAEQFDKMESAAKKYGAQVAVALGAATGAVAAYMVHVANNALEMDKLSTSTGITAEELGGLRVQCAQNGIELNRVTDATKALSEKMLDATAGSKDMANIFKAMNVEVLDSSGKMRGNIDVMADVADAFKGMKDGAEEVALAQKLMGDAGAELLPILNQGGDAMRNAQKEAEALGIVVDKNTVQAIKSMKGQLETTKLVMEGVANKALTQLTPSMSGVAGVLQKSAQQGGVLNTILNGLPAVIKGVVMGGAALGAILDGIGTGIGGLGAAIAALVRGEFRGALDTFLTSQFDAAKTVLNVGAAAAAAGKQYDLSAKAIKTYSDTNALAGQVSADVGNKYRDLSNATDKVVASTDKATKAVKGLTAAQLEQQKKEEELKILNAEKQWFENSAPKMLDQQWFDVNAGLYKDKFDSVLAEITAFNATKADKMAQGELDMQRRIAEVSDMFTGRALIKMQADHAAKVVENDRLMQERLTAIEIYGEQEGLAAFQIEEMKATVQEEFAQKRDKLEADMRQKQIDGAATAANFLVGNMQLVATQSKKAAEIGKAIHKAQALGEIGRNTYSAAVGAYRAMSAIPVVGPSLGVAAAAAVTLYGGMAARAVMSDAQPGAGAMAAPAGPAAPKPNMPDPSKMPTAPTGPPGKTPQNTYIHINPDAYLSGRTMIDMLNEAHKDGARVQFVADNS